MEHTVAMRAMCPLESPQRDTATHLWEKSSLKTSFNLPMTSFSQSGTKLPYFFITSSRNPLNIPEKRKCKHVRNPLSSRAQQNSHFFQA